VKPRGASRKGPNRLLATYYAERLAFHTQLNPPNRRMRTRMYGGVGGEDRRLSPLSRLQRDSDEHLEIHPKTGVSVLR